MFEFQRIPRFVSKGAGPLVAIGHLDSLECSGSKLFDFRQDKRKNVTVLEPTQVARVLQTATKWYPDHELAIQTLFYAGMREGELLGLQWDDFERGMVELRRTVSLGRGERRLLINTP